MFDWNDIRYFLAAARGGSTVAASKIMRVDQSTVSRRISALEERLGARLFNRAVGGYELTNLGHEILATAEKAELELSAIPLLVEGRARHLSGIVKVTTNETIADLFLMPALPEFAELYPDIRVDVTVTSRWLDIARGEADVALRAARVWDAAELWAINLSELPWAIYCSHEYVEKHGAPTSTSDLPQQKIIGVDGPLAAVAGFDWLETKAGAETVVARTNSLPNLIAAVRASLGISALPCVRGDADPELVRCIGPYPELASFLWLVTRSEINVEPCVLAFRSFIISKKPVVRELLGNCTTT